MNNLNCKMQAHARVCEENIVGYNPIHVVCIYVSCFLYLYVVGYTPIAVPFGVSLLIFQQANYNII